MPEKKKKIKLKTATSDSYNCLQVGLTPAHYYSIHTVPTSSPDPVVPHRESLPLTINRS